tara:strand:+ start:6219 stop:7481 length:1263 start_codon:yes stop_codon:yes gene_type:complete
MLKKIILKGPLLTRSGYGEQTRYALRALRSRPDLFDVFIQPLTWGHTSWLSEEDPDRRWIDQTIEKTIGYIQQGGTFDMSLQVTIPSEWEHIAEVNVGYTAGIETTQVSAEWIQKANHMDRIIVISNHAKRGFEGTTYDAVNEDTQERTLLQTTVPIEAISYPVKNYENIEPLELDLKHDFNFLTVAQWGPRKNIGNTLRWFAEEFKEDSVGLIVKTNMAKNCVMDREMVELKMKEILSDHPDLKCNIYLLHGDMTDQEMHALYIHPQINALVALTHGEGFGLPLYEAAYSALPVVAAGWSGHMDFLTDENNQEHFYNVAYDLNTIPEEAVWEGVLLKDSMWAYPREHDAKAQMRLCYENLSGETADNEIKQQFVDYAEVLKERFTEEKMYSKFVDLTYGEQIDVHSWLDQLSEEIEEHE